MIIPNLIKTQGIFNITDIEHSCKEPKHIQHGIIKCNILYNLISSYE